MARAARPGCLSSHTGPRSRRYPRSNLGGGSPSWLQQGDLWGWGGRRSEDEQALEVLGFLASPSAVLTLGKSPSPLKPRLLICKSHT